MRAFGVIGAASLTLMLSGGAAQAQAPAGSERLDLICVGSDAALMAMTPYRNSIGAPHFGGVYYGEARVPAQLGVRVENGQVRVKPPKSAVPLFAKDAKDGWYALADVAVDRLSIKGRLKWNRIDRSSLTVDRRNGAVTFGDFAGVCQQAAASADTTKF
ncbi:MAG: hypothetical protein JHD15_18255 [Phenylobacterium sp.]|uniref:hypothetical protein n=1 Tax=Phenylobacterium sp. TaxID=1871053 RepID=UPI001A182EE7|nr:hypothetical protein [Phenylobacterium sp.]MBJ7412289.1 hypothetical protein [Phenylobacterium sp.]